MKGIQNGERTFPDIKVLLSIEGAIRTIGQAAK